MSEQPQVLDVHTSATHRFSKQPAFWVEMVAGIGVAGDAYAGATVQHRSRARFDPSQPNLRQVHLLPAELFAWLAERGFTVLPGQLGENITTRELNLLELPRGARLRLGADAVVEITGLRNPCVQLDRFAPGLMKQLIGYEHGALVRRAGIMGVVVQDGLVRPGDPIRVELPPLPHHPLAPV